MPWVCKRMHEQACEGQRGLSCVCPLRAWGIPETERMMGEPCREQLRWHTMENAETSLQGPRVSWLVAHEAPRGPQTTLLSPIFLWKQQVLSWGQVGVGAVPQAALVTIPHLDGPMGSNSRGWNPWVPRSFY